MIEIKKWQFQCNGCKKIFNKNQFAEYLQKHSHGVVHIRGNCPYCEKYIKFVPFAESRMVGDILSFVYDNFKEFPTWEEEKNAAI